MKDHLMTYGPRKEIDISKLSCEVVELLVLDSFDGKYHQMNDQTMCLVDISHFPTITYQTLIIQSCGIIYRSLVPSNKLIQEYVTSNHSSHEETITYAGYLNYHQKIPVIIGKKAIIPSDGYSKKNVSWLMLNQVRLYKTFPSEKIIHLYAHDQLVLIISMSKASFEEQLERAALLVQTKSTIHKAITKQYNLVIRDVDYTPINILSERVATYDFLYPKFSFHDITQSLLRRKILKISRECFEEDDPYFDDFKDKLDTYLPDT